jgi:hypothetical protein
VRNLIVAFEHLRLVLNLALHDSFLADGASSQTA